MVLLQLVVFRHRWLFIPSCSVSGALTTGQGHCGASLWAPCAHSGGESISELRGWASVVVGSAEQEARTAMLLQESLSTCQFILETNRQS